MDTASPISIGYVDKDFVKENVIHMVNAEALRHDTNELNRRIGIEKRNGLGDTGK